MTSLSTEPISWEETTLTQHQKMIVTKEQWKSVNYIRFADVQFLDFYGKEEVTKCRKFERANHTSTIAGALVDFITYILVYF